MTILKILTVTFICMGGAFLGIGVVKSTFATWWIGILTFALAILTTGGE